LGDQSPAFHYEKPGCPESVDIRFVVDKVVLGQISLQRTRLCFISTITGMLHVHLHLWTHVALARRANGRSPGNLPKSNVTSEIGGHCIEKFFHHYFDFKGLKNTMQIAFIYCWPQSTPRVLWLVLACASKQCEPHLRLPSACEAEYSRANSLRWKFNCLPPLITMYLPTFTLG